MPAIDLKSLLPAVGIRLIKITGGRKGACGTATETIFESAAAGALALSFFAPHLVEHRRLVPESVKIVSQDVADHHGYESAGGDIAEIGRAHV